MSAPVPAPRREAARHAAVHGDLETRKRMTGARVFVTLARELDPELASTVNDLVGALPAPTVAQTCERQLLLLRGREVRATASAWSRTLITDVLLPIHAVVPIDEARFEEAGPETSS